MQGKQLEGKQGCKAWDTRSAGRDPSHPGASAPVTRKYPLLCLVIAENFLTFMVKKGHLLQYSIVFASLRLGLTYWDHLETCETFFELLVLSFLSFQYFWNHMGTQKCMHCDLWAGIQYFIALLGEKILVNIRVVGRAKIWKWQVLAQQCWLVTVCPRSTSESLLINLN